MVSKWIIKCQEPQMYLPLKQELVIVAKGSEIGGVGKRASSFHTSRDSSVGRASDWRSEGPWFNPGSRQAVNALLKVVGHCWISWWKTDLLMESSPCCDGRVVKALDLKSNGFYPRRFEPYSQRVNRTFDNWKTVYNETMHAVNSRANYRFGKKWTQFPSWSKRKLALSCCLFKG